MQTKLQNLTNAEGLEKLKTIGKHGNFEKLPSAKGLESLQSIGETAYFDSLTSIEIPNSVTSIGNYTFSDCDSLKKVTIRAIKLYKRAKT